MLLYNVQYLRARVINIHLSNMDSFKNIDGSFDKLKPGTLDFFGDVTKVQEF